MLSIFVYIIKQCIVYHVYIYVNILFQGKVQPLPGEESKLYFPLLIAGNKQSDSEFNSTNKNHMLVFPLPSSPSTTLFSMRNM